MYTSLSEPSIENKKVKAIFGLSPKSGFMTEAAFADKTVSFNQIVGMNFK